MQLPSKIQLAPFSDIILTRSLRRLAETARVYEQLHGFTEMQRVGDDIEIRYNEFGTVFRFTLKPHLRVSVDKDAPTDLIVDDWADPCLLMIVPRYFEEIIGPVTTTEDDTAPDESSPREKDRSPQPVVDRIRRHNEVLLRELATATHGPIRDFIDKWNFPGDCWNLHQACRFSERFRQWATHHPQLSFLATANMAVGAFDGPDNQTLLTWMTSGSFARMLRCAGLPPVRPLATILRRIPPPFLSRELRDNLRVIAGDPKRLDTACNLPAPLHPEILRLMTSDHPPFSRSLLQRAHKTLNESCNGRPEQFPPPPGPDTRRLWTSTLAPMRHAHWHREALPQNERDRFDRRVREAVSPKALDRILLTEDREKIFGHVAFFPGTRSVRPLRTLRSLVQVGDEFDNCLPVRLGDYVPWIRSGNHHIYAVRNRRSSALLEIRRDRSRNWRVSEYLGPKNRRPSGRLYKTAWRWAKANGIAWPSKR